MAPPIDPKAVVNAIGLEISTVLNTLKDKGGKRFGRAFGVAGFMIFAAYFGIYMPPQKKSARLQDEIDHAKMMSEYGAKFKDMRDQLNVAYAGLPNILDRDQWLTNSVRDSLTVSGLETEDFRPVREDELNGLIFQVSSVSMHLRFSDFYDWLLRVENARPLMHVSAVDLSKKSEKPGFNAANCDISTVIPKKRFH